MKYWYFVNNDNIQGLCSVLFVTLGGGNAPQSCLQKKEKTEKWSVIDLFADFLCTVIVRLSLYSHSSANYFTTSCWDHGMQREGAGALVRHLVAEISHTEPLMLIMGWTKGDQGDLTPKCRHEGLFYNIKVKMWANAKKKKKHKGSNKNYAKHYLYFSYLGHHI